MLAKNFVLISGLAALAFADPIPQDFDGSSVDAALASATSLLNLLSDLPTLPASVASVIATAAPSVIQGDMCELATGTPAWYKTLPADVKSALKSYESAVSSWSKLHSSQLAALPSAPGPAACTGAAAPTGAAGATTGAGKGAATGTATGAAESATKAAGAAPSAAVVGSLAGALGMVGIMLAL
ncbi:uncharacterized protein BP5553_08291 [Venustampulla echinocandica]|uniref:Infection structure specific protein n=1 Tax=Venustampulla echinocandica TaxID=2656787 RepID=A0A370TGB0_9HELO|nr:uncharacterized protein BP5553_08291 [Venustampulla echinocandica]RDL33923.1 hypothetical protein BP5553_08291 [Venustampulla echinocandica]